MITVHGIDELSALAGQELGASGWLEITQERVNQFADATGDHQWIHVDPERARQGPFGGPIAHGYLTLSLVSVLMRDIYRVDGLAMAINYGTDRVRFPAPLPVGASVRAGGELLSVRETPQGYQIVVRMTVEAQGIEKPVCVADAVVILVPA